MRLKLKQRIYEEDRVLEASSREEFNRIVREILPSMLEPGEREKFVSMDEQAQDEYISKVLSDGGIKAVKL
jgi:hypothetical protein